VRADGRISARQLSDPDVMRLFHYLDEDGNGFVSFDEFAKFVNGVVA
jgi:Ca2+-binding EF-hand superfamily protein